MTSTTATLTKSSAIQISVGLTIVLVGALVFASWELSELSKSVKANGEKLVEVKHTVERLIDERHQDSKEIAILRTSHDALEKRVQALERR